MMLYIKILYIFVLSSIHLMQQTNHIAPKATPSEVSTRHILNASKGIPICGIYKITNPKGKIYIGQSIDTTGRLKSYKKFRCKEQPLIYYSLKKYGIEKHKFEVIHQCEPQELDELEGYYIDLYQCFNTKHGLNLKTGGNGKWQVSDETRKKQSIAHKNNPSHTQFKKGCSPWNKGLNVSCRPLNKTKCICLNCGMEFYKFPSEIIYGKGKTCSSKCMGELKKGKANYIRTPEQNKAMSIRTSGIKKTDTHKVNLSKAQRINYEKKLASGIKLRGRAKI